MNVKQLPKDTGPAGWNCLLPKADDVTELAENITADWLIIGAGFAGLAAARRLAQLCPTDNIVILEASRVAEGPAGRNSGFMIDLPHDLSSSDYGGEVEKDIAQTKANRHGISYAREMAEEFGLSKEAFSKCGKINGAATSKGQQHNLDYASHLSSMSEKYEMLDAANMCEITGTNYYQGGLFTPGTAIIQPAMFVRGVASGLQALGISIYENSPVITLDQNSDWVAKTPKGQVVAPKVILAVNGHLNSFGFYKNRLMHVFTYASMTRALNGTECARLGGEPNWGVTPADPMGTTVRRISGVGGDRIIVRNRFTYDPSMEVDLARIGSVVPDHDRSFSVRFPQLSGMEMEYRWGGRLCLSRNNVSVMDELDTGLFTASCQNGLGTAMGTHNGVLVAEFATGMTSSMLDFAKSVEAPQKLPPKIVTYFAANAYIKWQEYKAGAEL
jgi:glycine/D-amino acid oxidase-like deaminating enzyme